MTSNFLVRYCELFYFYSTNICSLVKGYEHNFSTANPSKTEIVRHLNQTNSETEITQGDSLTSVLSIFLNWNTYGIPSCGLPLCLNILHILPATANLRIPEYPFPYFEINFGAAIPRFMQRNAPPRVSKNFSVSRSRTLDGFSVKVNREKHKGGRQIKRFA